MSQRAAVDRLRFSCERLPTERKVVMALFADLVGFTARVERLRSALSCRRPWFRLRSAEQLVHEGRRAEADEQLRRALAFYRSVGATRWIREGEALLAASA